MHRSIEDKAVLYLNRSISKLTELINNNEASVYVFLNSAKISLNNQISNLEKMNKSGT